MSTTLKAKPLDKMTNPLAILLCTLTIPLISISAAAQKSEPPTTSGVATTPAASGDKLSLVENGQPRAEIVIAPERPRMVTLAALELRLFIEKITGTRLPIVTEPTPDSPVKIYVGQSAGVDKLGLTAEGLEDGAYKIVSGPDWLVLLGNDFDFDPTKWPISLRRNTDGLQKWQEATKGKTDSEWGYPFAVGWKDFWSPGDFMEILTANYGDDVNDLWKTPEGVKPGLWEQDEGGTLNAVSGFVRSLGVQWFMAGELGEVLPTKTANLTVGPFNETVVPDFALRNWMWYNFGTFGFDDMIWARRIGMNSGYEQIGLPTGPHGLVFVLNSKAMQEAHPEYYALIAGKRDTEHNHSRGTPCFTSEGLVEETVKYIRFLYDTYDVPNVDIWPVDGLRLCQCDTCKGKSASELVWGFADKVAREVYKTHPDKLITCGAYTSYIDAPDSIEKFSPNLAVWIANSGRPRMTDDQHWNTYQARLKKWQSKIAPGNILRLENNRYHVWGKGQEDGKPVRGAPIAYPLIHPRATARDLKALKGISRGDTGEQSQFGGKWKAPGLEHITLYVQSRYLWDADLDIDEVLNDYCEQFYGPAAKEMKAFIDFAEGNLALKDQSRGRGRGDPRNVSLQTALELRDLLDKAKAAAGDTIYGQRVQTVINDLQPREDVIAAYKEKDAVRTEVRANAPLAKAVEGADLSKAPIHKLVGYATTIDTTFKAGWDKNALLLEILCKEPEMQKLKVSGDVNSGDYVAVSLETPNHSYYHIEINPDGTVVEGNPASGWRSLADVKTEKGPDYWLVKVRIPVVDELEAESDPNHRVAGAKPTSDQPWFFNVGRSRMVDRQKADLQMFSPTGGGWHVPTKFAKLEVQ